MQDLKDSNLVFHSIHDVELMLAKYKPAVREVTGKDITLDRIKPLMDALDNPQDNLSIIHVAGTSGKTSTAYYIARMLQGSGRKIGLTVSPHIDSLTERLQVNLKPISDEDFCQAMSKFMQLIATVTPEPTYFELLVAFAYWYFAQLGVDYAVIETGFGGLHDATNIAHSPDKVCVITDIGYDHMHILGNTLPEIASQKAGIIHTHNQVYMYRQDAEISDVFETHAESVGAHLTLLEQTGLQGRYYLEQLDRLPLFQQRNWLLARQVCEAVAANDKWSLSEDEIRASFSVQVPARMDQQEIAGQIVIMDGAHNEQKTRAFVDSYKQKFGNQKAAILLGFKNGRDYESVLPLLQPICSQLIVTAFTTTQEMLILSANPPEVAQAAQAVGFAEVKVIPDANAAVQYLLKARADQKIITGSFYLLSEIRKFKDVRA